MHKPTKALLIINKKARASRRNRDDILERLKAAGIDADLVPSANPETARRAISDASEEVDTIVVAGGDGTLNAVLPELLTADKPIGLIPMGMANDFARSVGVPEELDEAVNIVARGRARYVDVGVANGIPFLNAVNIGLGEQVARHHNGLLKRILGPVAYPLRWWRAWRSNSLFTSTVAVDRNEPISFRAEQVSVANSRHFGRHFSLDQNNSVDSGRLAVAGLRPRRLLSWLALAWKMARGKLNDAADAGVVPAREVEIETRPPRTFTVDGRAGGTTPLKVSVKRQVLTVLSPA